MKCRRNPCLRRREACNLDFDPNDYPFLVYDGEGLPGQDLVQQAMDQDWDLATIPFASEVSNPVTLNDLSTHNILIVGWTSSGSMEGLDPDVLASGITGRVVLTGHDADFHTANNLLGGDDLFYPGDRVCVVEAGYGIVGCGDPEPADYSGCRRNGGLPQRSIKRITSLRSLRRV